MATKVNSKKIWASKNSAEIKSKGIICAQCTRYDEGINEWIAERIKAVDSSIQFKINKKDLFVAIILRNMDFNYTHYLALIIKDLLKERKIIKKDMFFTHYGEDIEEEKVQKEMYEQIQNTEDTKNCALRMLHSKNSKENSKILIVDSNNEAVELLNLHLRSKGFEVYVAKNAKKALELVNCVDINMIIMELLLHGMDGFGFLDKIKKQIKERKINTIILTEKRLEEDIQKAFQIGVDDYITKPYSLIELDARIKRFISA